MKDMYVEILKLVASTVYQARDPRDVTKEIIKLYNDEVIMPTLEIITSLNKSVDKKD